MFWILTIGGALAASPDVPPPEIRFSTPLGWISAEQKERICSSDQLYVGKVSSRQTYHKKSTNPLNRRHPGFDMADLVMSVEEDVRENVGETTVITVPALKHAQRAHIYNTPVPYYQGERWLIATKQVLSTENEWHAYKSFAPTLVLWVGDAVLPSHSSLKKYLEDNCG